MYKKVVAVLLAGSMVMTSAVTVMAGETEAEAVATVGDDAEVKEALEEKVGDVTDEDGSFDESKLVELMASLFGPEDGEELYSDVLSFPYEGWHKIDLDTEFFISAGEDYSLVMYTDSYDIEQMLVSLDDPEDPDASDAVDNVVIVNEKDSFFMFNDQNEWMDWSDITDFMNAAGQGDDEGYVTFYDNPGLKAYAEPAVNLNASLEGYISDQGWAEGSEMYFRVIVGNPAGADFGPLIFRSALSGPADAMLIDEVPEGGTAEVNYIYYLTEEDVAAGTVTEYVTIQPAEASRLVGSVLRLSVFD